MSSNIINKGALLREQRLFPQESQPLSVEIDRAYVDISTKVNDRTIGFYPTNVPALNGEKWAIDGVTYSGFRQAFVFTSAGSFAHGISTTSIKAFTRIYGTATDGGNWFTLPYTDVTNANNQISLVVTPTNIAITPGAGAPPTITQAYVVLEWIA